MLFFFFYPCLRNKKNKQKTKRKGERERNKLSNTNRGRTFNLDYYQRETAERDKKKGFLRQTAVTTNTEEGGGTQTQWG